MWVARYCGALGELVRGRATGAGDQRAHLVEAGVQHVLRGGDAAATRDPPAGRKGGAPHEARGPDVAVDATLVAEAVHEAGLAEQFVELGLVRRGDLGADFGNAGIDVRGGLGFSGNGDADGPEECVRQFERRGLGDVEAVDEAVADQVEVAGDRRACFAPEGTQAREHLCGVAVGCEHLAGRGVLGERPLQALHLVGATRGHLCRTAHQAQQLGRRQARPVPNVGEEVPDWDHGATGEAHVLGDHGRMVVAAARQIGHQLRVGEGVRIDGLQLPVRGNGGWFAILVPVAKLLPPELLREDLFSALEALGDFGVRSRQHLVVAEAVHVADSGGRR